MTIQDDPTSHPNTTIQAEPSIMQAHTAHSLPTQHPQVRHCHVLSKTLNKASLAACIASTFLMAACSHTPTQSAATSTVVQPTQTDRQPTTQIAATIATDTASVANIIPPTDDELINQALKEVLEGHDHEPTNAQEAVAEVIAEQNLLNRIRAGFALEDADHVNVEREVAWFIRHPDYLDRVFRRGERYLYFIVGELEARKMPMELALLPLVESAFNPVALSKARAAGLWQFIPSTGRRYGLAQSHTYDGRRDIVQSTRAALDYLQFLANEFDGNWYQAIAAYNAGEMNVSRSITRNNNRGKPTDFFSLDLPRETRAYVPKLLAIRRIVAEPSRYGLEFGHMANQPYFETVDLDSPVDLGVAAKLAGISRDDLIALNPAYPRAVTSHEGPGHILVPIDSAEQLREGLTKLTPAQRVPSISYTVQKGDTVGGIAKKLRVSTDELRAANKIKNNTLRIGQELRITRGSMPTAVARASESVDTKFESTRLVSQDPNFIPPPVPAAAPIDRSDSDVHKVKRGETLASIAQQYRVSATSLANYNVLKKKSRLRVGQKLYIPGYARKSTPTAATLAANDAQSATVQRVTYVVQLGDTLHHIAKQFSVQIVELQKWNKLGASTVVKVGQKLVLFLDDARRNGG